MLYEYKIKKADLGILSGVIEAPSATVALSKLEEKGYQVLYLHAKSSAAIWLDLSGKVKTKDVVIFCRQLSILISAQVRLVAALQSIIKQTKRIALQKALNEIAFDVENGARFCDSLAHYPEIFPPYFVSVVKSGELSGRLEEVLNQLSDQLEKNYDFRKKVVSSLIYPCFIIGALLAVGVLMMIFVIPKMVDSLLSSGTQLPLVTRFILAVSFGLKNYWWLFMLIIIGVVLGTRRAYKTTGGKLAIDKFLLRLPLVGKLIQNINLVSFSSGLRTLLQGGVDMVDSLKISVSMAGNAVFRQLIEKSVLNVENGSSVANSFSGSKIIPRIFSQMLTTGEQAGKIEDVLGKISEFFSRETDNWLRGLMALIEPIFMIILCIAVAILVSGILLPMYQMAMIA